MAREPLTEEQKRVCAAAFTAWPEMIIPADEEMRQACSLLFKRGDLAEVRECEGDPDPEHDEVVGYLASTQLRVAMQLQAAQN